MQDEEIHIEPMTVEQLAEALREYGSERATPETIRADIAAGAPVNPEGTIDPAAYAAWLVPQIRQASRAQESTSM